jgi:hypothetical protein
LTHSGGNLDSHTHENQTQLSRAESDALKLPPSRAIRQINEALSAEGSPSGFLPAAENTLLAASDEFTGSLGMEAIKTARARGATAVDRQDVLSADARLRNTTERKNWMVGVAGFTGGGATSALIALLLASGPGVHRSYWWSAIVALAVFTIILFYISYPSGARRR